jgi:hypothetical protein
MYLLSHRPSIWLLTDIIKDAGIKSARQKSGKMIETQGVESFVLLLDNIFQFEV